MAKVTLGPFVVDARNRIGNITKRTPTHTDPLGPFQGGVVFTRGRAGIFARSYIEPLYTNSTEQQFVRGVFAFCVNHWQTGLTDAQREAWNTYALTLYSDTRILPTRQLSGYQAFMRVNVLIGNWGEPLLDVPPTTNAVHELTSLSISTHTAAPQALKVSFSPAVSLGLHLNINATPQVSPGRLWCWAKSRFISDIQNGNLSPYDMTAEYTAQYGALVPGKRVGIIAYFVNPFNGAMSQKHRLSAIIT